MKLMVIPNSIDMIKKSFNDCDAYLIGIKDLSINLPIYFNLDEVKEIKELVKSNNKELFVSLDKNMFEGDLDNLRNTLIELDKLDINGIFYYDISIVSIKNELGLKTPLVWSQEHFTTNYLTMDVWKEYGALYTRISSEITIDEINKIKEKTSTKLIVPIFGYIPMFASHRPAITNYIEHFNLNDNSNLHYIFKEDKKYPIIEDSTGTYAYNSEILNGFDEYLNMDVDYVLLNSFLIDEDKFLEILNIFKNKDNKKNIDEILGVKTSDCFLHTKTVYRVKDL